MDWDSIEAIMCSQCDLQRMGFEIGKYLQIHVLALASSNFYLELLRRFGRWSPGYLKLHWRCNTIDLIEHAKRLLTTQKPFVPPSIRTSSRRPAWSPSSPFIAAKKSYVNDHPSLDICVKGMSPLRNSWCFEISTRGYSPIRIFSSSRSVVIQGCPSRYQSSWHWCKLWFFSQRLERLRSSAFSVDLTLAF